MTSEPQPLLLLPEVLAKIVDERSDDIEINRWDECEIVGCREGAKAVDLCQMHYNKKYREENREKEKARGRIKSKKYREENQEKVKAQQKKWYEENQEKVKAQSRKWKKENPEKDREYNRRYRAKLKLKENE